MSNKNIETTGKNSLSKLELLRQNREIKTKSNTDIRKAIDGFASSIDTQSLIEEIAKNSGIVNFIIDCSGSMQGTSYPLSEEMNTFAKKQAAKSYLTKISLTLFDDIIHPQFSKMDVKQFIPIYPWSCPGGTNIYDALFSAITPIIPSDATHRLHIIITDGANGGSRHSLEETTALIKSRISNGEHIFLLFNDEDYSYTSAKEYAAELGINPENAANFNRNGDGIKIIFQAIENLLDNLRTNGTVPTDWARAIAAHNSNPSLKASETKYLGY